MILRNYQQSIFDQLVSSNTDAVFQLDTGGGKTPIITKLATLEPTILIAHRNMLIEQISQTLTKTGNDHQIIGNSLITKRCQLFQRNHGVDYGGNIWVGTVQSIISRYKRGTLGMDCNAIKQVIIDEVHHVAKDNMWAKMREVFPNARYLGCTATPCRLDGQGMHKDCGGLFSEMVQAEQLKEKATQWLIGNGYLSDYEYWCPPTNSIDFSKLKISNGKDFTKESLEAAINKELIAGDVLKHYKRLADNKRDLIYCPSIANAEHIAEVFKQAGYVATYIASNLSLVENMRRIDAFRTGEVKILINVEMVTEGFDLPEIECVQMLRPTASYALYRQMCGRNLRPKPNGNKAIFIDHAGNAFRHGLPDDDVEWSLFGTPKNKSEKVINCSECDFAHNAYLKLCPNCGNENWLRDIDAHLKPLVAADVIQIDLVRKVRNHLRQQELQQQQAQAKLEYEQKLTTEVLLPKWSYDSNAVGQLCKKLADWFVLNLRDTGLDIKKINQFTQGQQPPVTFWSSHFSIRDLNASNPDKCKKVFEKWLLN